MVKSHLDAYGICVSDDNVGLPRRFKPRAKAWIDSKNRKAIAEVSLVGPLMEASA